ncbi:MAG TPA: type II toxin-antitoxin system RelE/ParE family toxin [Thermoanaerobaculia bacterium]|nr:type II toxin-antitoxin system RelE/ParE family toxin [Thermoanaerobaculia bacterium]
MIVRARAKRDIREARLWYRNITRELGEDFVESVDDAIALAQRYPLAFRVVHRTFRRVLLRRFPYALFYQFTDNRLLVVAVLHQARDPKALRRL